VLKLVSRNPIAPEEHGEVEKIESHRKLDTGCMEYLVKWKKFSADSNQWIHESNFDDLEPITTYWKKRPKFKVSFGKT
jgi:hypothetical protein